MDAEYEIIRYDRVRHINVYISRVLSLKEHLHGSFELSYVLEGSALFYRGTETRTIAPGFLVLTNPYGIHSFATIDEKPLVLLTVQIHKLFARRYVENIPRLIFNCSKIGDMPQSQYDALVKLMFQMSIAYFGGGSSHQYDVMGYAMLLLGKLVSSLEWELDDTSDTPDNQLQMARTNRLTKYIDENYRRKITLSTLADMEGITPTYLSHFFKKAFGVSFQTYLSMIRFEKSLVLMHDRTLSVVDICQDCGFSDSRYLEAACQRTFGCSVAEYRKLCETRDSFKFKESDNILYRTCDQSESLNILKQYLGPTAFEALL